MTTAWTVILVVTILNIVPRNYFFFRENSQNGYTLASSGSGALFCEPTIDARDFTELNLNSY